MLRAAPTGSPFLVLVVGFALERRFGKYA